MSSYRSVLITKDFPQTWGWLLMGYRTGKNRGKQ
jgi:hypothetical protein